MFLRRINKIKLKFPRDRTYIYETWLLNHISLYDICSMFIFMKKKLSENIARALYDN